MLGQMQARAARVNGRAACSDGGIYASAVLGLAVRQYLDILSHIFRNGFFNYCGNYSLNIGGKKRLLFQTRSSPSAGVSAGGGRARQSRPPRRTYLLRVRGPNL
ncbi:hypothetical protein EVAR_17144_1 [Eumeta japonica]|uniref:Uncharacterized protein n=1 Tax=Eumeta variegata TaxID=151549 RepID=A0A4C1UN77_EUMVA|nr:hypothetical protein EVAR_17144_1 [Eumeta japonica]